MRPTLDTGQRWTPRPGGCFRCGGGAFTTGLERYDTIDRVITGFARCQSCGKWLIYRRDGPPDSVQGTQGRLPWGAR